MMDNIIHVHVYDPTNSLFKTNKNDRAEIHTYTCDKASECEAYANGRCILIGKPLGPRCFGTKSVSQGPTRRAKSFRDFVKKGREHDKYRALSTQPKKIFRVGEGYFMPYPHISFGENTPFEKKEGIFYGGFPYIESPSQEDLSLIYTHRPVALMGGEIKSYQQEVIPQLVKHIHDEYPELYRMLLEKHPDAERLVENFDYRGKKAVLSTLLPGTIVHSRKEWRWDGEYLTGPGSNYVFAPTDVEEVRLKPKEGATIEVTDNDMVGPETEIID